jgi:hypothetical protein
MYLPFVEPDGSLPCLQQPAAGPYFEPVKSNLRSHIIFVLKSTMFPDMHKSLFISCSVCISDVPMRCKHILPILSKLIIHSREIFRLWMNSPFWFSLSSISQLFQTFTHAFHVLLSQIWRHVTGRSSPVFQTNVLIPSSGSNTNLNNQRATSPRPAESSTYGLLLAVFFVAYSSKQKMEALCWSEASLNFYRTAEPCIPENSVL